MKSFRMLLLVSTALSTANTAPAQNWTPTSAPTNYWQAISASADGTKLAAVTGGKVPGPIYLSKDTGSTWTANGTPSAIWGDIASSADGNILMASVASYWGTNVLDVSTNAGGIWLAITNVPRLGSLTCSADGRKWIASAGTNGIYTSTNLGATWTSQNVPAGFWTCVASSAAGDKLAAAMTTNLASYAYRIYISRNSGNRWIQTGVPAWCWGAIAASADGNKWFATASLTAYSPNAIYRSVDSGTNWASTSAPNNRWAAIAASADGNKLLAAANLDGNNMFPVPLYLSTNAGSSWVRTGSPGKYWYNLTWSADGSKGAAIGYVSGGVWMLQTPPTPQLNLKSTGANYDLSWTVPSTVLCFAAKLRFDRLVGRGQPARAESHQSAKRSGSVSDRQPRFLPAQNAVRFSGGASSVSPSNSSLRNFIQGVVELRPLKVFCFRSPSAICLAQNFCALCVRTTHSMFVSEVKGLI